MHTAFDGDPEQHLFGVFDGHGDCGTLCSQFARDKVRVRACACFPACVRGAGQAPAQQLAWQLAAAAMDYKNGTSSQLLLCTHRSCSKGVTAGQRMTALPQERCTYLECRLGLKSIIELGHGFQSSGAQLRAKAKRTQVARLAQILKYNSRLTRSTSGHVLWSTRASVATAVVLVAWLLLLLLL